MKKLFPHMADCPERHQWLAGLTYGVVPFLILPMTLFLLVIGVNTTRPYVVLEYIYQIVNFMAVLIIFREYFRDSWLNVTLYPRTFWPVCLLCAALVCLIYGGYVIAGMLGVLPRGNLYALGVLPMSGMELMLLPGDFILLPGGAPAAILLTVCGPIITAGLFYASSFAPLCVAGHRFGAYLGMALCTALPRIISACTIFGGWKELPLYLSQLPIHCIACWSYQKTDTVWAPVFVLAISNAAACAALFAMRHFGIIG